MNTATVFFIEIVFTVLIVVAILGYMRPVLRRILVDLCGTDDRAHFWATFTNIFLLSLPLISALGFTPPASENDLTIGIIHQLRSNLTYFMLGLALIGFILLLFSSAASRSVRREKQVEQPK